MRRPFMPHQDDGLHEQHAAGNQGSLLQDIKSVEKDSYTLWDKYQVE